MTQQLDNAFVILYSLSAMPKGSTVHRVVKTMNNGGLLDFDQMKNSTQMRCVLVFSSSL